MLTQAKCNNCGAEDCNDVSVYNMKDCCKCRLTLASLRVDKALACEECDDKVKKIKKLREERRAKYRK